MQVAVLLPSNRYLINYNCSSDFRFALPWVIQVDSELDLDRKAVDTILGDRLRRGGTTTFRK